MFAQGTTILALVALVLLLLMPAAAADGAPVVTITSPGGLISDTYQLTAEVSGDLQPGGVYYGVDDDDPDTAMTDLGGGSFRADIDTDALSEGPHIIYVKAVNSTGSSTLVLVDVDVDRSSPVVVLTSEGGVVAGDFLVTATASDAYLDESAIYCVVDDDLNASLDYVLTRVDDHFEIVLDTTDFPDGEHFFRIWAFDLWGGYNKSLGMGMTVDNTDPVVEILSDDGTHSNSYILRATVIEAHLGPSSVAAKVGDEEPEDMVLEGTEWTLDVDLTAFGNGPLEIVVEAIDTLGHSTTDDVAITVDNRADLVISDVAWDKDTASAGETVNALITVRNDGDVNASGFTVAVVEGGVVLASIDVSDALTPGESRPFSVDWEASGEGDHLLAAQVDPSDQVQEYNEADNLWTATHTVTVKKDKGDDESPGPGAALAVIGLAIMATGLRRRRR